MGFNGISPVLTALHDVSAVTLDSAVALPLGSRRTLNGNDYLYVYVGGNAQISWGQMGFLSPASMLSGYTVTVSNAASQSGVERCVGLAAHVTLNTGSYGWLMTRGFGYIALDASEVSMNSGNIIVPGVDGGFVVKASYASNVTADVRGLGVALNSIITTVGTGRAMFKSPLFG